MTPTLPVKEGAEVARVVDLEPDKNKPKPKIRKCLAIAGLFSSVALGIFSCHVAKNPPFLGGMYGSVNKKILAADSEGPAATRYLKKVALPADLEDSKMFSRSSPQSSDTGSVGRDSRRRSLARQLAPKKGSKSYRTSSSCSNETYSNTRRNLIEQLKGDLTSYLYEDPDVKELMEGENPCNKVDATIDDSIENRKKCKVYLSLPYIMPNCTGVPERVPKIFHSVGRNANQLHHQFATEAANPDFVRHHLGDLEAAEYIREKCGADAAEAYLCLSPPAYRGDLFRFCALYSEGGVYLDQDIFPTIPLQDLYSPCSTATIGHDFPQETPGKQMKILAGVPEAPIFKCALENIIEHVRNREYPSGGPLELSGPLMLHQCFEEHSDGVAVTYHDTRNAQYPYSGMRRGNKVLACEIPSEKRHMLHDPEDYASLFYQRKVYNETCFLV